MSTILEQEKGPSGKQISWEDLVQQVANDTPGRTVIKTKNHRTSLLRHGVLSGAHFKIPGHMIAFESSKLHIAQYFAPNGDPTWVPASDDSIEVVITKDAQAPSVAPNGDISFRIGDTDYTICQSR